MLRLHQIFFYNFLAVFVLAFVLAGVINYFFLKSVEISQFTHHLKNNLGMLEYELKKSRDFDLLARNMRETTDLRLTIIAKEGLVLAESEKDKSTMDNHANRKEVRAAQRDDYGISIRHSKSLDHDFLYVAKRVQLYNDYVFLRLAVSLKRIMEDFYSIWIKITLIFALFIAVGFGVAYRISHRIKSDVDALTRYLKEVSNKNYKASLRTSYAFEFIDIAGQLKSVIAKLDRRERQRRKYTAKLRLINKQRNDLLSAISHEFKNPLAAILGYAQTLLDEDPTPENAKTYKKFLSKIEQNSKKITTMLDRIALSVKLENEDLELQSETFDLGKVAKDAISVIRKKYPDRVINFEYKEQMVQMDKTMIELVVINLLDNAMKYSDKDIRLKISKKRLSVIDHGMGIEAAELDKISSKFYRVDKNSWDNSMGLGLAIVSYILKLHKSQLEIQSEVGVGSVFSFKFQSINDEIA